MKKTLVLAVDRDNDFGVKAGVKTPVIGIDGSLSAAVELGVRDPEDSDVNGLFAAIKIYRELREDGKDAEVALICGDQKVGHRSDSAVIDELEEVLDIVAPDRVILVGDGAEDEYVYPIISSRVPIDSVKKVYVKQTPGVEGALYIFSKMLSDPDKRKRFLVPLGMIFFIIGMIIIGEAIFAYMISKNPSYIYSQTWSVITFIMGLVLILYGYNMIDKFMAYVEYGVKNLRTGNITITFTLLSIAVFFVGIGMGLYSIWGLQSDSIYIILQFCSNALWPIIFSVVFRDAGKAMNNYIYVKKVSRSFMVGTIVFVGLGFIAQGTLDFLRGFLGYGVNTNLTIIIELLIGVGFTVFAAILQSTFTRYFKTLEKESKDGVQ